MAQKNVLITGATSGIGRELARIFAMNGYNLIIVGRSQHELDRTKRELQEQHDVKILTVSKDLFRPSAAFELYDEMRERDIPVHILVNNAGQGHYGEFIHTDLYKELNIIQLNIASLVGLTKLFLRDMVRNGEGKILNLSSVASKSPGPWQAVYHGTKAFVQSFTEAIREEVKDSGVTVTALLPGVTDTDFFRKAGMEASKVVQDHSKMADPAYVAKDGYEALMKGADMVVSGLNNKIQVALNNIIPDSKIAAKVYKEQEPAGKKHAPTPE
jgi:short-subunit dehydrogenase